MAIKCAWASQDERGKALGGKAGDQTGKEVKTGPWYAFGQNVVIRPKDEKKAAEIAKAMKYWAECEKVGYDQSQRTTLWNQLEKNDFDYRKITKKVETDCSAMVAAAIRCAGIKISGNAWTGNLVACCKATDRFLFLYGSKYLVSDMYIKKGDIILNEKSHVIVALADGKKANLKLYSGALPTTTVNRSVGSRDDIRRWQIFVNWYYGKAVLVVDGSFGPETRKWTIKFQKEMGLVTDGSAGPKTLAAARTVKR